MRMNMVWVLTVLSYLVILLAVYLTEVSKRMKLREELAREREARRRLIVDLFRVQEAIKRDDEACPDYSVTKNVYCKWIGKAIHDNEEGVR